MKKKLAIAFAAFIVAVVAACGARACVDGRESAQDVEEAQAQIEEPGEEDAAQAEEEEEEEEEPTFEEGLRGAYDAQEREVASILASDAWEESGGTGSLAFTEEAMTEKKDGFPAVSRAFAIAALDYSTEAADDGSYTETYTIAASADGEVFLMALSRFHPASGAEQSWSLYSSSFSYAYTYYSSSGLGEVEVAGITDELAELIGGEDMKAKLVSMIQARASESYPTARTATWDGAIATDEEQGIVIMTFRLDNEQGSTIQAMHVLGTDGIELSSE